MNDFDDDGPKSQFRSGPVRYLIVGSTSGGFNSTSVDSKEAAVREIQRLTENGWPVVSVTEVRELEPEEYGEAREFLVLREWTEKEIRAAATKRDFMTAKEIAYHKRRVKECREVANRLAETILQFRAEYDNLTKTINYHLSRLKEAEPLTAKQREASHGSD